MLIKEGSALSQTTINSLINKLTETKKISIYDELGFLKKTEINGGNNNILSNTYEYNSRGFLTKEDSTTYTYDTNGNVLTKGNNTFTYTNGVLTKVNNLDVIYDENNTSYIKQIGNVSYEYEGNKLKKYNDSKGDYIIYY